MALAREFPTCIKLLCVWFTRCINYIKEGKRFITYLEGFRTLNMLFSRDCSTSSEFEFTGSGDPSSRAPETTGSLVESLAVELFPIFFLILPLIERIDPRDTREGDVSFFFKLSAESCPGAGSDKSGDELASG